MQSVIAAIHTGSENGERELWTRSNERETANDRWRIKNGEREMENEKWRTRNGGREMANEKRRTKNGERGMENEKRRTRNDKGEMENEKRLTKNGQGEIENEKRKREIGRVNGGKREIGGTNEQERKTRNEKGDCTSGSPYRTYINKNFTTRWLANYIQASWRHAVCSCAARMHKKCLP